MLDGAAEVVRLAYDVWPSYGGAFVSVSKLVGLLFAPLTIRSARSTQKLAVLHPEIQRIQRAHADDPAARNAATVALYRSYGGALGTGCLFITLRLAVLVVLFMLVRGFATLDPSNGGGPRYVEQGTALWQSLQNSGGQLPWFGVDLGQTLFTPDAAIGVLSYMVLLIVLIVLTAESLQVSVGMSAIQGAGVLVGGLILLGAVVLHLVAVTAFSTGVDA